MEMQREKENVPVFPFLMGTTSCIYPADIPTNVSILGPRFHDIELILYEEGKESNIPGRNEITLLKELQSLWGLTYTVHFPLSVKIGCTEEGERKRSVRLVERIFYATKDLNPSAYILHAELQDYYPRKGELIPSKVPDIGWISNVEKSIEEIILMGINPETLCLENLEYSFRFMEGLLRELGLGFCLDVGHLLLYGYDVEDYVKSYFDLLRVVHLHGIEDKVDHKPIKNPIQPDIEKLIILLETRKYKGIVTLELFDPQDLQVSIETLRGFFSNKDSNEL